MSSSSPPSEEEEVILVIGACALDRLLTVATYPSPDAKVRTTSYHEMGGGNAANTAAAMGFLKDASFLSNRKIRIRLLTKVGDDAVGRQLKDELEDSGVDTSSPLFQMTHQTCTSFGTIIVDQETHTRTCLFTCGSCGELTLKETDELVDVDHVFQNVVWVHSDSRHTAVSLWLAQHAKTRNIPVSCDSEKDRNTKELDQLLEISNVLFTNSGYMAPYLDRLESEYSEFNKRPALVDPKVRVEGGLLKLDTIDMYCKSLTPAVFYDRWHDPFGKEVIVTHGNCGALHYQSKSYSRSGSVVPATPPTNEIQILLNDGVRPIVRHCYIEARSPLTEGYSAEDDFSSSFDYMLHQSGVLKGAEIVDTTGAGDAFIGGYIMARLASKSVPFCMDFASWVGGQKVQGPGARSALPKGSTVDELLGSDLASIETSLKQKLSSFNEEASVVDCDVSSKSSSPTC